MVIALFLILIGVLFLLRNTGLLPDPAWSVLWPLILIIFGGAIFFHTDADRKHMWWPSTGNGRKRT